MRRQNADDATPKGQLRVPRSLLGLGAALARACQCSLPMMVDATGVALVV